MPRLRRRWQPCAGYGDGWISEAALCNCRARMGRFHAKAAQEMAALRRLQSELEAETGNACFLGLSAAGTVQQCLRLGNARAAGPRED